MLLNPVPQKFRRIQFGSTEYYPSPSLVAIINGLDNEDDVKMDARDMFKAKKEPSPVVLINAAELRDDDGQSTISSENIEKRLIELMKHDDVLDEVFIKNIILLISQDTVPPGLDVDSLPQATILFAKSDSKLASAPYFLVGHSVHQAFKLYPDPYAAFICGVVPSGDDAQSYHQIATDLIPVPSRLYFPPADAKKPLSGKRVAVKDIFDIRGLKTTAGSKEHEALYKERNSTATSIQALIDQGAVIVGKTKTVCFASGAGPNDWVDYQCPINPRGDGNLDPDCSSTGSAVAVAAYEWLDFSIGSDSLGSMVGPAAVDGIIGLRPTQGALPIDGGILVSTFFDTPGHFSRSIPDFAELARAWLPSKDIKPLRVEKLLYIQGLLEGYNKPEHEILENFFRDFENATSTRRESLDFGASCEISDHDNKPTSVVWKDYLSETLAHIQLYDSRRNNQKFEEDFRTEFGRDPVLEPLVRYKRDLARSISGEKYNAECNKMHLFKAWLHKVVFKEGTVMFLPIAHAEPELVRQPNNIIQDKDPLDWQGFGLKSTSISVLGGLPCISFPVGHTKYYSHIQNRDVFRPINLMLLGPPGSDIQLIDLLQVVFSKSGRPLSVKVGETMY